MASEAQLSCTTRILLLETYASCVRVYQRAVNELQKAMKGDGDVRRARTVAQQARELARVAHLDLDRYRIKHQCATGGRMDGARKVKRLRCDAEALAVNFIDVDIGTAMTFLDVAKTEFRAGEHERGNELLVKAKRAYETVAGFLPKVKDSARKRELQLGCRKLRKALREIETEHFGNRRLTGGI